MRPQPSLLSPHLSFSPLSSAFLKPDIATSPTFLSPLSSAPHKKVYKAGALIYWADFLDCYADSLYKRMTIKYSTHCIKTHVFLFTHAQTVAPNVGLEPTTPGCCLHYIVTAI